jgi:hypothetical protein
LSAFFLYCPSFLLFVRLFTLLSAFLLYCLPFTLLLTLDVKSARHNIYITIAIMATLAAAAAAARRFRSGFDDFCHLHQRQRVSAEQTRMAPLE